MNVRKNLAKGKHRALESLESRHLLAGIPQLMFDLNQLEAANPRHFAEYDGRLFFVADHETFGAEVWTSDGSAAGTQLLADLNPGAARSNVRSFVESGGLLYFVAENGTLGAELWRTDGTMPGTLLVADIAPGAASGFKLDAELVDVEGTLFFVADSGLGAQLWQLGGTPPTPVKDITPLSTASGISELTAVGNRLFFVGDDGVNGGALWISDGSPAGTRLVQSFSTDAQTPGPADLTNFNGALLFSAPDGTFGRSLYRTYGTTSDVAVVYQGVAPKLLTVAGDWLYFQANVGFAGTELWKSDGSSIGTTIVRDLETGSDSSTPEDLTAMGDTLFFTTRRDGRHRLWKTDGTEPGTVQLTAHPGDEPWERADNLTVLGDKLYFTMRRGDERTSLWHTDGTPAGTLKVVDDIIPEGSRISPAELGAAGGMLYFRRIFNQFDSGGQLWKFDPATSNASMVKFLPSAVSDSSFPHSFTPLAERTLFVAQDGFSGEQLWSRYQNELPVRMTSGLANIANLTRSGNWVYFTAVNSTGERELWRTGGTSGGTNEISGQLFGLADSEIGNLRDVGGRLFFTSYRPDGSMFLLAISHDGSQVGFVRSLGTGSRPPLEAASAGGIYYVLGPGPLSEIWRSDGTAGGTYRLLVDSPEASLIFPQDLITRGNELYFLAYGTAGMGLWRVAAAGAPPEVITAGLDLGAIDTLSQLTAAGDRVYFSAELLSGESQLWVSDGSAAGTRPLLTLPNVMLGAPELAHLTDVDGTLMFVAQTSPHGYALSKSDGTEAGTVQVADLGSAPSELTAVGERLYFRPGAEGVLGESDGTAAGTLVHRWNAPEQISDLTNLNGELMFSGYSHEHGWEAWTYQIVEPTTIVGRRLFYNQSKYDGNAAGLNANDDKAIATDKAPYFAGSGLATFSNISSYSRGINGVMIDIAHLPPASASTPATTLQLRDFEFRVGRSNDLASWTVAPAPSGIAVRSPVNDLSELARVSFSWPANFIENTWLEITVLANERTGLDRPDVFYFGSRIGDTGTGTPTTATTTAADALLVRHSMGPNQAITSVLDFNRDWSITAFDEIIARVNSGSTPKLNLPAPLVANPLVANSLAATPTAVTTLAAQRDQDELLDAVAPLLAEGLVGAFASGPSINAPSRAELLACAVQSWNEWLDGDRDDEHEFAAGLIRVRSSRK